MLGELHTDAGAVTGLLSTGAAFVDPCADAPAPSKLAATFFAETFVVERAEHSIILRNSQGEVTLELEP